MDFGTSVTALPNGNFVVTDPRYNSNRGAAYLFNPDGVLISRLSADISLSSVGSGGVTVLANGDYVVSSPDWTNSYSLFALGAATLCSQETGCSGMISPSNSLVGSSTNDYVGAHIIALNNGNYLVISSAWDAHATLKNVGAVTWANGADGVTGVVSADNSLVGASPDDRIGRDSDGGITLLSNGNYLVRSPGWDNGSAQDAGAITWGNGLTGVKGEVSSSNSLVGSSYHDYVGYTMWSNVTELTNGNYVVSTVYWDLDATHPDAGAVTWGDGASGVVGAISAHNSLVGIDGDAPVGNAYVDNLGVIALSNGNYVVSSPYFSLDGSNSHMGAATWGNGQTGVSGPVSSSNSLVGSYYGDYVGYNVIALTNGNYVVVSYDVDLDAQHVNTGAVTWGDGSSGITGPVSEENSLVGPPRVSVGNGGVIALANGNYAVSSPAWSDHAGGPINVGAVTWGDGTTGITGMVSALNSLVGESTYDMISDGGLVALTNGNYVVNSRSMRENVGFITWVDGSAAITGVVSAGNSLTGSTKDDHVGGGLWSSGVVPLSNGNYLVSSPWWDNGSVLNAGAITWGDGENGTIGVVAPTNSLVGGATDDQLGSIFWEGGVDPLPNGSYVVSAPQWDAGDVIDVGAVTWGNSLGGTVGLITPSNSLVGNHAGDLVGSGQIHYVPGVSVLPDGNYLVHSPEWSDGSHTGAVTWGNGESGTSGLVSADNSLVSITPNADAWYESSLYFAADGTAWMHFPVWTDGIHEGAVSLIVYGTELSLGPVSAANSVLGLADLGGHSMVSDYDPLYAQLMVGRPRDNIVTIMRRMVAPTHWVYLPALFKE